jgi:Amt family ammonium transporter
LPLLAALATASPDLAAEALRSANNGFVLLCAALVLLMTPALSLFYGGFVRSRNVLNTMVMSFAAMAVVSVLWVLFGYSLVFAPGHGALAPFLGGLQWAGLENWAEPWGEGQLSQGAVALFQLTFAIITPALVSGAVVERMHFGAWLAFLVLWTCLIYLPLAHMVWGPGGFLGPEGLGALDFAGGLVVEMASGTAAAVAAAVVGRRRLSPQSVSPPHNVPFILLGAGLLWAGLVRLQRRQWPGGRQPGQPRLPHHQQRRRQRRAGLDGPGDPPARQTHRRGGGHRRRGRPGGHPIAPNGSGGGAPC